MSTADPTIKVAVKLLRALEWVDSAISRTPVVGAARSRVWDAVLDTLFGAAEDFNYVSRTAPREPPPTP